MSAHEGLEAVLRGEADFGTNMLSGQSAEIDFTPLSPAAEKFVDTLLRQWSGYTSSGERPKA